MNANYSRRDFLTRTGQFAAATAWFAGTVPWARAAGADGKLRAAVIGHTGKGNYGHGLDMVFEGLENVEVVAVADADAVGLEKAAAKIKAAKKYLDYRELLKQEKPQLVSIAPRWTEEHYAMGKAALEAGAHIYMEKPFTQTLMQADELLALAERLGKKMVVAHQMRLAPSTQQVKQALEQGVIGDLLEIHAFGKQDKRAGGEDMLVLGTHLFDLMRFFAGDAQWCSARIQQSGHDVTLAEAHPATEGIGLVIGDEVEAQFAFAKGVTGTFTSRERRQKTAGDWGLMLVGSKGAIRIKTDVFPNTFILKAGQWNAEGVADAWQHLENDPSATATKADRSFAAGNNRAAKDWLEAIRANREPACSARNAMKSLEMVMGVFEAGVSGRRAVFPLVNRKHPLEG